MIEKSSVQFILLVCSSNLKDLLFAQVENVNSPAKSTIKIEPNHHRLVILEANSLQFQNSPLKKFLAYRDIFFVDMDRGGNLTLLV